LTFIALLMPQLVRRSVVACVLTAGLAALLFHNLPHQSGLIVAALAGVIAGVAVERAVPAPRASVQEPV
jgi:predicted branched-subunit amino acid permease